MKLKEVKQLIDLGIKADVPFLLIGHSGIGKTSIVRQVAKEKLPNHKLVTIMAATQDVGDFIGLPALIDVEITDPLSGETKVVKNTTWGRAEWMPVEPCVLFLDEINNARPDVESGLLQLVLEKRIHTHELHPDSYICAAMNPAGGEYTTCNIMSDALIKRFMIIPVTPTPEEFVAYGKSSGELHTDLGDFLAHYPEHTGLHKSLNTNIKLSPCPRTYMMLSRLIKVAESIYGDIKENTELLSRLFQTTVGLESAGVFCSWLETLETPIKFENITEDVDKAIKKLKEFNTENRNDLIGTSCVAIVEGMAKELMPEILNLVRGFKTSFLYELDDDKKSTKKKKAIEEFKNLITLDSFSSIKGKLDKTIKFMEALSEDRLVFVAKRMAEYCPINIKDKEEPAETYISSWFLINMYMFDVNAYLGRGHRNLAKRLVTAMSFANKEAKTA